MGEKTLNKGELFFRQGEEGDCFYQIEKGAVRICVNLGEDNELVLSELHEGDFFGEMAIIEAYPRSASAVAIKDGTTVRVIGPDETADYLEKDPETAFVLMQHIGNRLRNLTDNYNEARSLLDVVKKDKESIQGGGLAEQFRKHRAYGKACRRFENADSVETLHMKNSGRSADGFAKQVESYPKGTVIFKEGETGDCMYGIHGGNVGIYTNFGTPAEKHLTTLAANDFFGEMGMISQAPRSATAVTITDDTIIEIIKAEDLKELFEKNPAKGSMIINHLSNRLRKLTDSYADVCQQLIQHGE